MCCPAAAGSRNSRPASARPRAPCRREDHVPKAARAEFGCTLHRRLAAFDHVRQQWNTRCEACAGRIHLRGRRQRLDEQRVDAARQVGLGAIERGLEAFDGHRVGARQDQRVGTGSCIERGTQLATHLGGRHQRLAVEVAATLREALVFELHHRGAGALEAAHGALHIQRIAEAGVGVDDHRQLDAVSDSREGVLHLAVGRQAHVRTTEPRVRDQCARQVQRLEAGLLGDQRRQRVVGARCEQHARLGQTPR